MRNHALSSTLVHMQGLQLELSIPGITGSGQVVSFDIYHHA